MTNPLLEAALSYLKDYHFSIVPWKQDKKGSLIDTWKEFQERLPTEEEVRKWWKTWPHGMIAIVCGKINKIMVVDWDKYKPGAVDINEYIPELAEIPMSLSPRGGHHYYFSYPDGNGRIGGREGILKGVDLRAEGSVIIAPPSINEIGREYKWSDVKLFPSLSPPAPPLLLNKIINDSNHLSVAKNYVFNNGDGVTSVTERNKRNSYFEHGCRDGDLFHAAFTMIKGGADPIFAEQVIERIAQTCDNVPSDPLGKDIAKLKVKSALERRGRRERSWQAEVEEWVSVTERNWSVTDLYRDVTSVTREDKTAVRMAVKRLKDAGVIESAGNRSGWYKRVDMKAEVIDIFGETKDPIKIFYPMGIEKMVHTMPKSIIIVAGESDAGKTGFFLSLCHMNMDHLPIHYFSSEMGPTELKSRVKEIKRPIEDWKKVDFRERSSDFHEVIYKDDINIIDYLELSDDFFLVGGQIKKIFDKLEKGIAIVAIQKKTGVELARGGDFSLEKSRLYITLSRDNLCRIIKAKNWVDPMVKPAGKVKKYALYRGWEFFDKTDWVFDEDMEQINPKKGRKL